MISSRLRPMDRGATRRPPEDRVVSGCAGNGEVEGVDRRLERVCVDESTSRVEPVVEATNEVSGGGCERYGAAQSISVGTGRGRRG